MGAPYSGIQKNEQTCKIRKKYNFSHGWFIAPHFISFHFTLEYDIEIEQRLKKTKLSYNK